MTTRHVANILATLKTALGIASPSRVFIDAARAAKLRQYAAPVSPPWYAARGPREPWETPELAAAARRVRRLIRRHWWALFFEPESSIAASVRAAIATPPKRTKGLSLLEALRQLEALGMAPQVDPGYARMFHEQTFGRADRGAT